ncbi:excalibur calcium-binding domain-containing protein [Peribacillus asahii]|uniref:excalibur calcium-binding domain-containing protein n=1 Tax=Peribacillus asahii TaxID=228899 RepID=UPI0037F5674B
MSKKKESDSQIIKRLIKKKHPDAWLIEFASIGNKLITNEYGAFTRDGLTTYVLSPQKKLTKTGEMTWPREKHGEVDHFAIKSHFAIDGLEFVTGNRGKEVQKFLEDEKKDSFTKLIRPFYQKILGFRSTKKWKMAIASIVYLFILFGAIDIFVESDTEKAEKAKIAATQAKEEEEKKKVEQEEAERLAEEQRQKEEEAQRLAEEKKKQEEEAQRLAEEQKRKEAEAARLAEEQRQEEQRLAEEQDQQKEATNVYFKNCSAAKAAGAAPVYAGEPGYGKHLDRDGDGIGCDR